MIGIRHRLILGFGGLLAVVVVVGVLTMTQIDHLGKAIDVILKENYRSVIACQNMKESLERMDSGILYTLAGNSREGNQLIEKHAKLFRSALDVELGNITIPGELEKARRIELLFDEYLQEIPMVTTDSQSLQVRQTAIFCRNSTAVPGNQETGSGDSCIESIKYVGGEQHCKTYGGFREAANVDSYCRCRFASRTLQLLGP